ncbi:DUF3099 domain-containing protein [Pseudonocardia sp.]|jgi:hypothetical protein|uniref:DUF3099 domain-containing protein n=1 Tax=Pseudonocardia sp. TaxID=60912 RepID=UPI0031FCB258
MMSRKPPVITDAVPSFDEEQAHRRRTYVILMGVHIVGFASSYPLYLWRPVAGVVAVVLTGVLPWVAVLLANSSSRRVVRRPMTSTVRPLDRGSPSVDGHDRPL